MKYIPLLIIVAGIAAMPIFGWSAIPTYFNHSVLSAVLIGLGCGVLLVSGILISAQ